MTLKTYVGPREKLQVQSVASLSDHELIQAIIGSGSRGVSLKAIARRVLKLLKQNTFDMNTLQRVPGLGAAGAAKVLAGLELAQRYYSRQSKDAHPVNHAAEECRRVMHASSKTLLMVSAGSDEQLLGHHIVPIYENGHTVTLQYLFRRAIQDGAQQLYIARYSEGCVAEDQDVRLCKLLYSGALTVGMRLSSFQLVDTIYRKELL